MAGPECYRAPHLVFLGRDAMIVVDRTLPRHYNGTHFAVSQIVQALMGTPFYGSEADKQRGQDIHTLFRLEVSSITPEVAPPYEGYYHSLCMLTKLLRPTPIFTETPSLSSISYLPFGGTPDFYGWTERR